MKILNLRLLRLIKNSKGHFIATVALVVVGLLVYTGLSMAAVNLEDTVNYYYRQMNFADIFVDVVKIPKGDLEKLTSIKGIEDFEGRLVFDVSLKSQDDERAKVRVVSLPYKYNINQLYMVDGKKIDNGSKDVLVIQQFANARKIKAGDTIKPYILGKTYNLKVSGIVASPEYVYLMENEQSLLPMPDKFGVIYISEDLAGKSFGFKDSYNQIIVKVKDGEDLERVKEDIEKSLKKYGVKGIYTKDEQLSNRMVSEEIKGVKKSSSAIPLIFLGVAAIIIAAMLSRMVQNDRMSIGVFKALGYNNRNIILHYTKYSLIIGLAGSILGIIFGTVLSGYIAQMYIQFFNIPMLKFEFYYKYIFLAIMMASMFCILAGLWGAKDVLKIFPAESMRPESPKAGKEILLSKINIVWKRLSFSWKVVLRNIFRNKKRVVFISFGIAMTFAITLLPVVTKDAFNQIFEGHYGDFQRMDYNVNFAKPVSINTITDIKYIVDIDKIEPKIEYPFELIRGTRDKNTNILGLLNNTELYNFINLDGKHISLPKKGMVLSEGLARYFNVNKGDKIKIKTYIPGKDDIYVEVKDIIKQSLGSNGYMDIRYMQKYLLEKGLITGVYINSKDDVKNKLEDIKNISSVQSLKDMKDVYKEFLQLTIYSIGVMLIFAGVLGFAIVYNSTIMAIGERRLEFSSLRVLGFSKDEIYKMISKENMILALIGIIIGIPMGKYMLKSLETVYNTELYTMEFAISIKSYIITALLTMAFVLAAQLVSKRRIDRLDFIEALKNRIS